MPTGALRFSVTDALRERVADCDVSRPWVTLNHTVQGARGRRTAHGLERRAVEENSLRSFEQPERNLEGCDPNGGSLLDWRLSVSHKALDSRLNSHTESAQTKGPTVGFLGFILLGLIAGAIAIAILPRKGAGGFLGALVVGVLGALLGGWIGSQLGIGDIDSFFDIGTWLLAIGGSLLVLVIYGAITGRRR